MNLSNFVQQVSGETVTRAGAACEPPFLLACDIYQVWGLYVLWQYSPRPKIFSSISTSVTWILSLTVLNLPELGWAVAPVHWGCSDTTGAAQRFPRAHGQSLDASINQAHKRECWGVFLGVEPAAGEGWVSGAQPGWAEGAVSQGGFAPSWAPCERLLRPAAPHCPEHGSTSSGFPRTQA